MALPLRRDAAAAPALPFEAGRFACHLREFTALADACGGLQPWFDALEEKRARMTAAAAAADPSRLTGLVFTARRRLGPVLDAAGTAQVTALVGMLLEAGTPLPARIAGFCAALPYPEASGREGRVRLRKLRGAARDLAAELLHFTDPAGHPLATRWVWDAANGSGAVREMTSLDETGSPDFGDEYAAIATARDWLVGCLRGEGIYRDQHWWADLLLGTAYLGYFRAMTGGILGSDFTRAADPADQLRGLLGLSRPARG